MQNKLSPIGLDIQKSEQIAHSFKQLLSNYQILYMNTRGFHWNIKGPQFFELHLKFEELYNNFQLKIDEIAERILTLGHVPMHRYSDYLKTASIKETEYTSEGQACIDHIISSLKEIIILQRAILNQASEINDEGSSALMSDYIREQEKQIWMFQAYRH